MADNSTLDPGTGGDVIRDKDRAGVKTQIVGLDLGIGTGSESLMSGVMPVSDNGGSLTVDNAGTFAVQADTELTTADLDTGAGSDTRAVVGLALAASGGAVLAGAANPVPISDNSGSITVDGTVTANAGSGTMAVSAASLPLPSGASTAAKQPALGTAGSASADVLSVQGIASMTALKVDGSAVTQPVSDAGGSLTVDNAGTFAVQIAANSSVNQAQVAGTATSVNSGNKDAGTQRFVIATDQPQLTNALKVDGSAVAQPVTDNSGSLTVDAPVGTPVFTTVTPSATGGWSKVKYAAQTTTKQAVKAAAGTFGGYYAYNPNSSVAYIQVFDVASAGVTVGTTAPDMIFGIPAASAANLEITNGVNMGTAITLVCTTTATGSSAPSTGLDLTIFYK